MTPLRIDLIRIDGGTQPRAHLNPETVTEYAEAMQEPNPRKPFPPVTVFYDGADYWLADGFHRVAASKQAKFADIDADIRQGTRRDAVLFSVGANFDNGLPRTNADKRRAVLTLLNDEEWRSWSDHKIAERCAVSHMTVLRVRREASLEQSSSKRTYTTKHGTVATMQVGNIGRTREPREEPPTAPPAKVPLKPLPAGQVGMAPVEDTPTEHQAREAAVFVLDAADRLLAAIRHWPDPADAVERLRQYPSFPEKLPIVAAWLARLDQHWNAQDRASLQTGVR